jgi:type I restriction enzyme S subunit
MEGERLTYITTSNLYWDRFELSTLKEMLFTKSEIEKCTACKGDLLVCEGGDIGRAAIWQYDYDIRIQNHIHRLRGLGEVNHRLFLFWFMYLKTMGLIGGKGIGLMGLSSGELDKLEIPVPPLREQDRIVRKIDNLFVAIQKLDEDCSLLMTNIEQSKSKILDLAIHGRLVPQDPSDEPASEFLRRINPHFVPSDNLHYEEYLPEGWCTAPLSSFCTTINGLWKGNKEPLVNVGVIRNANFTKDFGLDYSKIEYIDVELKSFEKRNLEDGDIIVEKSGGSDNFPVGRSILFKGDIRKYSFSNFTMSLRILDKGLILPKYLYYALQYKYRRGDMKQMQTQTTGLHNLLTDKFLSAPIPIPPVSEQEKLVEAIEDLFRTIDEIRDLVNDGQ